MFRVDIVLVPSKHSKEILLTLFPFLKRQDILVVVNPIDPSLFYALKRKRKTPSLRVMYAGRIDRNKGLTELLSGFLAVQPAAPLMLTVSLALGADKSYEHKVMQLLGAVSRLKNVKIYFNCTPKRMAFLYRNADIVVIPSTIDPLPLVYLESIACGTPVLTGIHGDLTEPQRYINAKLLMEQVSLKVIADKLVWYSGLSSRQRFDMCRKCVLISNRFIQQDSLHIVERALFY